jgi:hypothetical protein
MIIPLNHLTLTNSLSLLQVEQADPEGTLAAHDVMMTFNQNPLPNSHDIRQSQLDTPLFVGSL